MDNLIIALNVVAPLFLSMSLGYVLRHRGVFSDETLSQLNTSVFKLFLPLMLFYNIYNTDLKTAFDLRLIIFSVCAIAVEFAIGVGVSMLLEKDNRRRGVLAQVIFRSNYVLFGIPVAYSLFGDEATGLASMLVAVVVPMFNGLAVVALESFRAGKFSLMRIVKGVVKNPLIIASALGFAVLISGLRLPDAITTTVRDLSRVATPLAFIALGGTFRFDAVRGNVKTLVAGVAGRLVLMPLLALSVAIRFGFTDAQLVTLMVMTGAPAAVSSYSMATQMDAESELAGQFVIFTSLFSILTIFLWAFAGRTPTGI